MRPEPDAPLARLARLSPYVTRTPRAPTADPADSATRSRLEAGPTPVLCERVRERLSEYVDGELDPVVIALVDVHLAACPACHRFACELGATISALHQLRCGECECE